MLHSRRRLEAVEDGSGDETVLSDAHAADCVGWNNHN